MSCDKDSITGERGAQNDFIDPYIDPQDDEYNPKVTAFNRLYGSGRTYNDYFPGSLDNPGMSESGSKCLKCPAGKVANTGDSPYTECVTCGPGTVRTSEQTECTPCTDNTVPNSGHTFCQECPDGHKKVEGGCYW